MNKYETEVHKYWIKTILSEGSDDLTEWEADFVMATRMTLQNGQPISDKQEAVIEKLYEKITR